MHKPLFFHTLAVRLLALILFLSQLPVASARQPQGPPVPAPKWARSHDYDVQHYRNDLSFDWERKTVTGETTVTLRPFKSDFRELLLDAGEMTIKAVALAGKPLQFKYEENERLRVALDRAYKAGEELSVTVAFSAEARPRLHHAERRRPDAALPDLGGRRGREQSLLVPVLRLPERFCDERDERDGGRQVRGHLERQARQD
jgi:hypothetical protein